MTAKPRSHAGRKRITRSIVLIVVTVALVSGCKMPRETTFPTLDITSRTETDPKIVCTNCECSGDQCFCETCTITADPPPSN